MQTIQARFDVKLHKTILCVLGNDYVSPAIHERDRQLFLRWHPLSFKHDGELESNSAPLIYLREHGRGGQQDQESELDAQTHGVLTQRNYRTGQRRAAPVYLSSAHLDVAHWVKLVPLSPGASLS